MALRLAGNLARLIEKQHAGIPNQMDAAYQMTLGRPPPSLSGKRPASLQKSTAFGRFAGSCSTAMNS